MVRVQANDGTNPAVNSAMVPVAAINAQPSGATATRDIDPSPDNLVVRWNGKRDTDNTDIRIIGGFESSGTTTWVVLDEVATLSEITAGESGQPRNAFTFAFESSTLVTNAAVVDPNTGVAVDADKDGTNDTMDLTADQMSGAFMVRVQARQPDVDVADGTDTGEGFWKSSNTASVTKKP